MVELLHKCGNLKAADNMQDRLRFCRLNILHCSKVTHFMHSYRSTSYQREEYFPMQNKHGWRMMGCKRKKMLKKILQSVWLTDHSLSISKFSPGKGTPQLFMAQSLLDGHLWLISEQVVMYLIIYLL